MWEANLDPCIPWCICRLLAACSAATNGVAACVSDKRRAPELFREMAAKLLTKEEATHVVQHLQSTFDNRILAYVGIDVYGGLHTDLPRLEISKNAAQQGKSSRG